MSLALHVLATVATLGIIAGAGAVIVREARRHGARAVAALRGRHQPFRQAPRVASACLPAASGRAVPGQPDAAPFLREAA